MSSVLGIDEVVKAFNEEIKRIGQAHMRGKIRAGALLISKSKLLTPLITGNLRGSGYVDSNQASGTVIVGYQAVYALRVHENPRSGKTGKLGASKEGEWKFLERPFKENQAEMIKLITDEVSPK